MLVLALGAFALIALIELHAITTGGYTFKPSFAQVISGNISDYSIPAELALSRQYQNGTGAGKIDLLYNKSLPLVASTPQTLDLTTLLDPAGGAIAFARVREFILRNDMAGPVTIGGAAATQWVGMLKVTTGTLEIPAGGFFHFVDTNSIGANGAVVGASSKSLKIDPGSNAGSIKLIIAGCSAAS